MESPIITLKGYPKKNVTLQLFFQGTYSIHICMNKVFKKLFFKDCTFKFLMTFPISQAPSYQILN